MNLMLNGKADYVVSGSWSKKAFKEAQLFGDARCVASSEDGNFSYIPNVDELEFREDADYVYICENETIYGTHYHKLPETGDVPLVSDVSSCFLSEPIDVIGLAVQHQVHGDGGKLLSCTTLQEQHLVVVGDVHKVAKIGFGFLDDALECS